MNSVAFNIFGIEVMWYGVIIAFGVIMAMVVANFLANKRGLNFEVIIDAFLIVFPISIICARLYYVIFEIENYHSFIDVINIRNGGMAIHGGVIGALVSGYIFARYRKINFFKYVDVVMPGVILAQAIGRWGNFMNQEAHGGVVTKEFISKFPEFIQNGMLINGNYYNPTFLYESIWNLIVFVILVMVTLKKKEDSNGVVLGLYLILYSVGRVFIEGLRTDSLMFMGIRMAQAISIVGIIIGIIIIIYSKKRKDK